MTDGRPAGLVAIQEAVADLAVFDLPLTEGGAARDALAWTAARTATPAWERLAAQWIAAAGWTPHRVADAPGLIVARTVAMIINEAADAVLQGVADADAVDKAMTLAVNYPAGPFEWLKRWNASDIVQLLDHLDDQVRGDRYRVSLELRQLAWLAQGPGKRARAAEHSLFDLEADQPGR
jgi:3-hydroxybutyryl-CoA dehydrogenase